MGIKKNYLYNLSYQIFLIFFPLITIPYAARVLGAEGIGIFAFSNSIVQYFVLFANLGVTIYAYREIAKVKSNSISLNRTFNEILGFQIITSFLSSICFIAYILIFQHKDQLLYIFQIISIFSVAVDISWFYIGIEDFKKNAIRNVVVKAIVFIFLFFVVKSNSDLLAYVLLSVISVFLGQLFMWIGLKKYLTNIKVSFHNFFFHLKNSSKLFYIVFIGVIGVNVNKILLGVYINQSEVGKFEIASKIIMLLLVISTSLGSVMLPRIASTNAEGNTEKVKLYINYSFNFISLVAFGLCAGIIALSHQITDLLLGNNFTNTHVYLQILAPIIIFNSWSNIFSTQFMIPTNNENKYILSLVIGCIFGLASSFLLIPIYSSIGACISFFIGEIVILTCHLIQVKNLLPIKKMILGTVKYFISALILSLYLFLLNFLDLPYYLRLSIMVIGGLCIYFLFSLVIFNTLAKVYLRRMLFKDNLRI